MAIDQDQIARAAAVVRAAYCRERAAWESQRSGAPSHYGRRHLVQWDGGRDSRGRNWQPIWPRIAIRCLDDGVDIDQFVKAQFMARPAMVALPNQLLDPEALATYRAYIDKEASGVAATVELGLQVCKFELTVASRQTYRLLGYDPKDIHDMVLRDRSLPLSALFRYCMATRLGLTDSAGQFREAARDQYLASRDSYDRSWAGWLPTDLAIQPTRTYQEPRALCLT